MYVQYYSSFERVKLGCRWNRLGEVDLWLRCKIPIDESIPAKKHWLCRIRCKVARLVTGSAGRYCGFVCLLINIFAGYVHLKCLEHVQWLHLHESLAFICWEGLVAALSKRWETHKSVMHSDYSLTVFQNIRCFWDRTLPGLVTVCQRIPTTNPNHRNIGLVAFLYCLRNPRNPRKSGNGDSEMAVLFGHQDVYRYQDLPHIAKL